MMDILQKLKSQIGDDIQYIFNHEALFKLAVAEIEALRADLAKPKVKPLAWRCHRDPKDTSEARTQIGSWTVWEIDGDAYCHGPNDTCGRPISGGLEGAKAAAQADYERRILSALEGRE